jgi:NADPH:quinone reductase-like Zn-dependent oxidoreductase
VPKRLAITGPYVAEVTDYEEPPLQPKQVRVRTELASAKYGTTTAMFDGSTFRNQVFDRTMRLFLEAPPPDPAAPEEKTPSNAGSIGAGVVIEVGGQVTGWQEGDRVFGAMDVRDANA